MFFEDDPSTVDDDRGPFGRIDVSDDDRTALFDGSNPFKLAASVGFGGRNHALDVAKIERLTGAAGDLDLEQTDGPTGYAGARTDQAIKCFQERHGLKTDGLITPNGPTIRTMEHRLAGRRVSPHRVTGAAFRSGQRCNDPGSRPAPPPSRGSG